MSFLTLNYRKNTDWLKRHKIIRFSLIYFTAAVILSLITNSLYTATFLGVLSPFMIFAYYVVRRIKQNES